MGCYILFYLHCFYFWILIFRSFLVLVNFFEVKYLSLRRMNDTITFCNFFQEMDEEDE